MEETKRKIIEIYATENKEEGEVTFNIEKTEDSDIANNTMKMLVEIFSLYVEEEK